MGCGRSTLGSDSPKKSKKKAVDAELSSDDNSSTSNNSSTGGGGGGNKKHRNQQQQTNKLTPVGGGPLRAQAKISSSQQNFFMMLDQKIEMGPDYESEEEEVDRYRRLHEYAEQWHLLTHPRPTSPATPPTPPMRFPADDTCGSGEITEEDEDDEGMSEPECIPDEAVREQYMFMGNLYTLTHIRTDTDKTEPKVDVEIPAKSGKVVEDGYKFNGSAIPEEIPDKDEDDDEVTSDNTDNKQGSRPPSRSSASSRPASLILRSVFPSETNAE